MSGIASSPRGAKVTKDISDLQTRGVGRASARTGIMSPPEHRPLDLLQSTLHSLILKLLEHLKRTDGITDCFGCNVSILRGRR